MPAFSSKEVVNIEHLDKFQDEPSPDKPASGITALLPLGPWRPDHILLLKFYLVIHCGTFSKSLA